MANKKLDLRNSIYQQQGSGYGLTQKNGMLINNAPDSRTGIQQLCETKKMMKRSEKISTYSEAIAMGNSMSDCGCD
jgi:hypothetical protein